MRLANALRVSWTTRPSKNLNPQRETYRRYRGPVSAGLLLSAVALVQPARLGRFFTLTTRGGLSLPPLFERRDEVVLQVRHINREGLIYGSQRVPQLDLSATPH